MDREPEPGSPYESRAEAIAFTTGIQRRLLARIERRFVADVLRSCAEPKRKVLDLGTGPGWIPIQLKKARPEWEVTAVDASRHMLDIARVGAQAEGVSIRWVRARAEDTGLPPDEFDLVLSHYLLHEVGSASDMMAEAVRITKGGGLLIVEDAERSPSWRWPLTLLFLGVYYAFTPLMRQQAIHSTRAAYRADELARLLRDPRLASLEVVTHWKSLTALVRVTAKKREGIRKA